MIARKNNKIYNYFMNEVDKERLKNLISLRSNLFTVVIVLTTGVLGLFFVKLSKIMVAFLFLTGIYFDFLFLSNLLKINEDIEELLGRNMP